MTCECSYCPRPHLAHPGIRTVGGGISTLVVGCGRERSDDGAVFEI